MKSIQPCMAWVAGAAVVCSGLLAAPARAKEPVTKPELPYQVLNVFQQQCLRCHGDDAPKGRLRILHHAVLVEQRKVIRPFSPETSELIDLVQGGSMPPGNCLKVPKKDVELLAEWVRQGAAALPGTHDESYVLWSIAFDLRKWTEEQKRSIRYLSLNHLLARESTSRNLAQQLDIVKGVLRDFVPQGKQPPQLQPIEKTGSVFRIDLAELGWMRHPYPKSRLNLFDLILLEYPYGRLPTGSPFYHSDLLNYLLVLQTAGQVRPIPYIRADWFAETLAQPLSPLRSDLLTVLKKQPQVRSVQGSSARSEPTSASEIAGGWYGRGWREHFLAGAGSFLSLPTPPLRRGEKEQLAFNQEQLAELLSREAKSGIPILPLDGLDYRPKPTADVAFRAIDFRETDNANPKTKDFFVPGDRMSLWIKIEWDAVAEMFDTDKDGSIFTKEGLLTLEASKPMRISGFNGKANGLPMELNDPKMEEDVDYYIIYAYPREELKTIFPNGTRLRAEGIHDRFVHPFYELQNNGQIKPPDPSKMVKVVLPVRTCRPKK